MSQYALPSRCLGCRQLMTLAESELLVVQCGRCAIRHIATVTVGDRWSPLAYAAFEIAAATGINDASVRQARKDAGEKAVA